MGLTYSLWDTSAGVPGGVITNGDLGLRASPAALTRTDCAAGAVTPTAVGTPATATSLPVTPAASYTATFTLTPTTTTMDYSANAGTTVDFTGLTVSLEQKRSGGGFQ